MAKSGHRRTQVGMERQGSGMAHQPLPKLRLYTGVSRLKPGHRTSQGIVQAARF